MKDIISNTKITLTQRDDAQVNPWFDIHKRYKVPSSIEATIKSCKEYGLFIEIEEGVVGLLHVSEVGAENIKNFKPKDTIEVVITKIDAETKKVFLKLKK